MLANLARQRRVRVPGEELEQLVHPTLLAFKGNGAVGRTVERIGKAGSLSTDSQGMRRRVSLAPEGFRTRADGVGPPAAGAAHGGPGAVRRGLVPEDAKDGPAAPGQQRRFGPRRKQVLLNLPEHRMRLRQRVLKIV